MEKAHFFTTEDKVQIHIPFAKGGVDEEKRTVSGFATIDNVDKTDDVVTAEASLKAWETFRGNVREQHSDIAAGRVLDYHPEEFMHKGKLYNGIYANVYVSKGAPTTWEKVVDGTLSGFSIGGNIKECHTEYIPDEDRTVRFITKYEMVELSLVDSPANQLCNVLSIHKKDDGSTVVDGLAVETKVENVFWCETDRISVAVAEQSRECVICKKSMENIGWFEPTDEPAQESIKKVLQDANKLNKKLEVTEGGSEKMSEEVKPVEEEVETAKSEEEEKEVSDSVTTVDEPDLAGITKALEEIQSVLSKANENDKAREESLNSVREAVETVEKSVEQKLNDFVAKFDKLEEELKATKDGLGNVEKRFETIAESVEKASAVKKSSDVQSGDSLEKSDKDVWQGRFLPKI